MIYKQHVTTLKKFYPWPLFWGSHAELKCMYTLYNLTIVLLHSIMDNEYFVEKWYTSQIKFYT